MAVDIWQRAAKWLFGLRLLFAAVGYTSQEGQSFATIIVERTGNPIGAATVLYATGIGDALGDETGNGDYIPTSGILDFADTETAKAFMVAISDDQLVGKGAVGIQTDGSVACLRN